MLIRGAVCCPRSIVPEINIQRDYAGSVRVESVLRVSQLIHTQFVTWLQAANVTRVLEQIVGSYPSGRMATSIIYCVKFVY